MSESIYAKTERFNEFIALIESGEIPDEAIQDTLECLVGDINAKIEDTASYLKEILHFVDNLRAEEKAIAERRKAKERLAERLEGYISHALKTIESQKYESAKHQISFKKSKRVVVQDEQCFYAWARQYRPDLLKVKEEISKNAIAEALRNGETVKWAKEETSYNLQIK